MVDAVAADLAFQDLAAAEHGQVGVATGRIPYSPRSLRAAATRRPSRPAPSTRTGLGRLRRIRRTRW
ncbi:hypothetical protein GCM10009639_42650 [Kitasatospora putterlickiae]|uniref:Uncharacterized protein n=1 Tax=Kitasatospora putterlickiae TaxID=221725 RepID=A0ABP4J1E1_9ACTN